MTSQRASFPHRQVHGVSLRLELRRRDPSRTLPRTATVQEAPRSCARSAPAGRSRRASFRRGRISRRAARRERSGSASRRHPPSRSPARPPSLAVRSAARLGLIDKRRHPPWGFQGVNPPSDSSFPLATDLLLPFDSLPTCPRPFHSLPVCSTQPHLLTTTPTPPARCSPPFPTSPGLSPSQRPPPPPSSPAKRRSRAPARSTSSTPARARGSAA